MPLSQRHDRRAACHRITAPPPERGAVRVARRRVAGRRIAGHAQLRGVVWPRPGRDGASLILPIDVDMDGQRHTTCSDDDVARSVRSRSFPRAGTACRPRPSKRNDTAKPGKAPHLKVITTSQPLRSCGCAKLPGVDRSPELERVHDSEVRRCECSLPTSARPAITSRST
jgi:hypothetical protein